ncbi:hypothetical protein GPJ56_008953 [Histomonas meleagridis]|uniref:uncharacterized protein n=1 Tax=Histomonas meleagridis TaxID=135588 RepID=UPI003559DF94|nr:hypothetical protein GPJ56_008953 [Histomonas meleagridis]KAH0805692.1 hypothetical protein GO595_001533 [Histomonas meleagridis]
MITCNCTEETQICYAFDPSTYPKFKIIPLKKNEWSPLPTIIPEHPSPRYEHPKGAKVLSLWMNQESNQWSSIFYTATVSKRPCDRYKNDTEDRGYELTFFDGTTQVVPEKFIVSSKDKW